MATIITPVEFAQDLAQLVIANFGSVENFARIYNESIDPQE